MTRSRTLFALLVVALLAAMSAPVGAARARDPRAAGAAARAGKAKRAAELTTPGASEKQLLGAARALNDQVLAQAAKVDAARQAVRAATAELVEADQSLKETRSALSRLGDLLVERAVEAYMAPSGADPTELGDTKDLAAAARKRALLDAVSSNASDLIDELSAAKADSALELGAARAAKAKADARRKQTESALAALERAQSQH